jgi:hypothetical protein
MANGTKKLGLNEREFDYKVLIQGLRRHKNQGVYFS